MTQNAKRRKVNVFGNEEGESPNVRFNEAIDTARRRTEEEPSLSAAPAPQPATATPQRDVPGLAEESAKKGSKQTIQKTDYFTQEQLDKLDDLEYLIKKKKGKTLRRFEILGILVEQCDADAFIEGL